MWAGLLHGYSGSAAVTGAQCRLGHEVMCRAVEMGRRRDHFRAGNTVSMLKAPPKETRNLEVRPWDVNNDIELANWIYAIINQLS